METRPSPLIEAVVALCLPAARREDVLGDLCERYTSPTAYVREVMAVVPVMAVGAAYRSLTRRGRTAAATVDRGRTLVERQIAGTSYAALRMVGVVVTVLAAGLALATPTRRPYILAIAVPALWMISSALSRTAAWVDDCLAARAGHDNVDSSR